MLTLNPTDQESSSNLALVPFLAALCQKNNQICNNLNHLLDWANRENQRLTEKVSDLNHESSRVLLSIKRDSLVQCLLKYLKDRTQFECEEFELFHTQFGTVITSRSNFSKNFLTEESALYDSNLFDPLVSMSYIEGFDKKVQGILITDLLALRDLINVLSECGIATKDFDTLGTKRQWVAAD